MLGPVMSNLQDCILVLFASNTADWSADTGDNISDHDDSLSDPRGKQQLVLTLQIKAVSSCPPVATRSGWAGLQATAKIASETQEQCAVSVRTKWQKDCPLLHEATGYRCAVTQDVVKKNMAL